MTHCFKQLWPIMMITFLAMMASVHSSRNDDSSSATKQRPASYQRSRRNNNGDPDYRFTEDYFERPSQSEATDATSGNARLSKAEERRYDEINDESNNKKSKKSCERVIKNSMICMICKDPKTNSKYEQCSYVPLQRSAQNNNNNNNNDNDESAEYSDNDSPSRYSGNYNPTSYENQSQEEINDGDGKSEAENGGEGRTRQDYNIGEEEEKARDDDGTYAYADSERYSKRHYPNQRNAKYAADDSTESRDYRRETESDDAPSVYRAANENSNAAPSVFRGSNENGNDNSRRKSRKSGKKTKKPTIPSTRRIANDDNGNKNNCKQIQRDSMTCTICADPQNGGNFERCSYAHQPNDKLYKFSKSRTFGYPTGEETAEDESSSEK